MSDKKHNVNQLETIGSLRVKFLLTVLIITIDLHFKLRRFCCKIIT